METVKKEMDHLILNQFIALQASKNPDPKDNKVDDPDANERDDDQDNIVENKSVTVSTKKSKKKKKKANQQLGEQTVKAQEELTTQNNEIKQQPK